ncbi:MAG: NAD-dependent epimerase/dehydratase family protein [Planctomycetaceae bacterium]
MTLKRIAITGSSGFYGRGVVQAIRRRFPEATILGLDITPPLTDEPDEFVQCDVLSEQLRQHLTAFGPDTVIHLAFVVNPMRDECRMHRINVEGTRNLLQAVSEIAPARLLVSSSATAYGGWPDNPLPMAESWQLRARTEYRYAEDKVLVEALLEDFAESHQEIAVSWTRPCIIYGPEISNYLTDFIKHGPIIVLPGGNNTEMQFVHLEDVSEATVTILEQNGQGPFNVAPGDWLTLRDLARLSNRVCVSVPLVVCRAFTNCWWALRLPLYRFPSGLWYFIRYRWVISPSRLESELKFEFRRSSLETARLLLADAGKLSSASQPTH